MWGEKKFSYLYISSCFYFLAVHRGPNLTTVNFRIHNLNKTRIFPLVEDLEEGFSPPPPPTTHTVFFCTSFISFMCVHLVCLCVKNNFGSVFFWLFPAKKTRSSQLSPCTEVCYTRLDSCAIVLVQHLLATSCYFVVKKTVWIQTFLYFFIIIVRKPDQSVI